MNYETAKKLKDAGFPKDDFYIEQMEEGVEICNEPTLDELVKACGDKIGSKIKNDDGTWSVYSPDRGPLKCENGVIHKIYDLWVTNEELDTAVAEFWWWSLSNPKINLEFLKEQ